MEEYEFEVGDSVSLKQKELPPEKGGWERLLIFLRVLIWEKDLRSAFFQSSEAIANAERFRAFMRRFDKGRVVAIEGDRGGCVSYRIDRGGLFADGYKGEELKLVKRGNIWKYKHGEEVEFDRIDPLMDEFGLNIDLNRYIRGKIFRAYDYREVARLALVGELDWFLVEPVSNGEWNKQFVAIRMSEAALGNRLRQRAIKEFGGLLRQDELERNLESGKYRKTETFEVGDIRSIVRAAKANKLDWFLTEQDGDAERLVGVKMDDPKVGEWARQTIIGAYGWYDQEP